MQLNLPVYPTESTMISAHLGVYEKGGIVQYIANGLPIHSHKKDDLNTFRYITSNFIVQGLCKKRQVVRCFQVSESSVHRWYKKLVEEGESAFYSPDSRHGRPHKIIGALRTRIQNKLDKGQSVNSIAKEEGIRESAIRYQIKQGFLKKSLLMIASKP